ncbi:hypothetical protein ABH944_000351 [Caballeronia udeis]|uniref:Uncharacterized protein n=1 Tax=Caballeronia udeis TaxID=1232866 RepID=A0ABW8MCZ6_9BURK
MHGGARCDVQARLRLGSALQKQNSPPVINQRAVQDDMPGLRSGRLLRRPLRSLQTQHHFLAIPVQFLCRGK